MCGVTGLFDSRAARPFDKALIQAMTDAVAHRGPDGEGVYNAPGVALGHRRLAFIDLAGGVQPMQTADGALTVVFNGEIYNFPDLMAELKADGAVFQTRSDTEVLLHGWRRWGTGLFARLRGMFAFALWDAPEQRLILARDRFGKKPMHYALLPDGRLAFGSEIKSLLLVPGLDRTLDLEAVEDFFTYGYVPDPKTIYAAIRKLPAAHALIATRGRPLELLRYWNLLDNFPVAHAPERAAEKMVEHLRHSVKLRLISDVEVGALLSGGVDSGAVVSQMAGLEEAPISTFSIGFGERDFDESAYAASVSRRYGTNHHTRIVDPDDFSLLPRLPAIYDEPFGDISALPTFAVCKLAVQSVKAALTGDGGDEVLAGYRRYAFFLAQMRARRWLPDGVRQPLFSFLAGIYPHAARLPRMFRAKTTFQELARSPSEAYLRMVSALHPEVRGQFLSKDFRKSLGGYDSGDIVRRHFNVEAPLDTLQRAQYADIMTYLPGDILTKVDRASMANSLELRAPFLDQELASWAFSLPDGLKWNRGAGGKAILKKAMEACLPPDILYRPKQGFTVPVADWFRGPLRENVLALSKSGNLRGAGLFEPRAIDSMAQDHVAGRRDFSKPLWLLWVFDSFLEHDRAKSKRDRESVY
jgi:asparagine synthase (glutamine-hydrolysing)